MEYPPSWLKGSSLGESIANQLRLQIIRGQIKSGEVLSENRIAADFGTSRSPVREALKTLSAEGLITLQRMGAVVVGLHLKDIIELYDVRFLIESFAWQQPHITKPNDLLSRMEQIIDKMELAAKHQDHVDFTYQDLSFHETMIQDSQHTRIMHLWASIRPIVLTVMLITNKEVLSRGEEQTRYVINKHRKLLKCLQTRDLSIIQSGVEEYFADSRRTLQASLPHS
ncbi:GntR family transcriptional regulator [Paenibacillus lentus]|uniref:GntR family transcriptional regulator n=1 Tax=Paenibacillus lentus TaxID=1338368 RepID=UPI003660407B